MSHCSVVETLARYKREPISKAIGDRNDRIMAYEEGIGDLYDDFSTLPAHVRSKYSARWHVLLAALAHVNDSRFQVKAIYPKLNRAASSRIIWAYKSAASSCVSSYRLFNPAILKCGANRINRCSPAMNSTHCVLNRARQRGRRRPSDDAMHV